MLNTDKIITTWDFSSLFSSDTDPKIAAERLEIARQAQLFATAWQDRQDYLTDPDILRQALDQYEQWCKAYNTTGVAGYYLHLRSELNQLDSFLKAESNKTDELSAHLANLTQFFGLRLSKISTSQQTLFLQSEQLAPYKHFLEHLFAEGPYLLSEDQEQVFNLTSQSAYGAWVRMTATFLSKEERPILSTDGQKAIKNFSEIASLLSHKSKAVRDDAADAFNDIMVKHAPVATEEMNAILGYKKVQDELRKLSRPDQSRHLSDDIETDVVDALLSAVESRFDVSHRFYRLKAQLMGVQTLAYHERSVEYGEVDTSYPFNDSATLVHKVFIKLDPQFAQIFERFLVNGQIDVYPAKGKAGGAFCAHEHLPQPTYILLNHTNRLNDVLTLAHELGHGINNELMREKQHELNYGTPMATAEVASTFMEDFVLQELSSNANNDERLSIMMMKLNDDISSIMRQVAGYRFEQSLHQKFKEQGYVSQAEIGQLFQQHMASYMGDAVEQSAGSENWWVYWSHFRAFFYVYSYASGLLISKSLQASVKQDPAYIQRVKEFLSAGLSASPKTIFANLDIDITQPTFWLKGLNEIETLLNETELLARKLGKIS
jgi:oligoendopeptidase F